MAASGQLPLYQSPSPRRKRRVKALFLLNARQLGTQANTDLYLDPHTKHYTGMQAVLKGWCPGIGHPDKAMHCDLLHTAGGAPLYFEITDNADDLRERLPGLLQRARQTLDWPLDKVLTLIVDRAVFGLETFAKIQADPALHLITWEKGYQADGSWPAEKVSGKMVIERLRNRADVQIIGLMFQRWLQENDFKYQIKHFGLNQVVSYQVVAYAQWVKKLTDRQVESEAYRVLVGQRRGLKREQGHWLVEQDRSARHAAARQKRLEQLAGVEMTGAAPACIVEREQERKKLLAAQTRHQITANPARPRSTF